MMSFWDFKILVGIDSIISPEVLQKSVPRFLQKLLLYFLLEFLLRFPQEYYLVFLQEFFPCFYFRNLFKDSFRSSFTCSSWGSFWYSSRSLGQVRCLYERDFQPETDSSLLQAFSTEISAGVSSRFPPELSSEYYQEFVLQSLMGFFPGYPREFLRYSFIEEFRMRFLKVFPPGFSPRLK